jgi:hypothetical protein
LPLNEKDGHHYAMGGCLQGIGKACALAGKLLSEGRGVPNANPIDGAGMRKRASTTRTRGRAGSSRTGRRRRKGAFSLLPRLEARPAPAWRKRTWPRGARAPGLVGLGVGAPSRHGGVQRTSGRGRKARALGTDRGQAGGRPGGPVGAPASNPTKLSDRDCRRARVTSPRFSGRGHRAARDQERPNSASAPR